MLFLVETNKNADVRGGIKKVVLKSIFCFWNFLPSRQRVLNIITNVFNSDEQIQIFDILNTIGVHDNPYLRFFFFCKKFAGSVKNVNISIKTVLVSIYDLQSVYCTKQWTFVLNLTGFQRGKFFQHWLLLSVNSKSRFRRCQIMVNRLQSAVNTDSRSVLKYINTFHKSSNLI